jgi:hypothetical protein
MKFEKHISEEGGNMDLDLSVELLPATRSKKMRVRVIKSIRPSCLW